MTSRNPNRPTPSRFTIRIRTTNATLNSTTPMTINTSEVTTSQANQRSINRNVNYNDTTDSQTTILTMFQHISTRRTSTFTVGVRNITICSTPNGLNQKPNRNTDTDKHRSGHHGNSRPRTLIHPLDTNHKQHDYPSTYRTLSFTAGQSG